VSSQALSIPQGWGLACNGVSYVRLTGVVFLWATGHIKLATATPWYSAVYDSDKSGNSTAPECFVTGSWRKMLPLPPLFVEIVNLACELSSPDHTHKRALLQPPILSGYISST